MGRAKLVLNAIGIHGSGRHGTFKGWRDGDSSSGHSCAGNFHFLF